MEVAMDVSGVHHHHHQQDQMCSQTLESMLVCNKAQQDKKPRPPEEALNCPRCDSSNTKFCYYNNYSLTQPRYFCKSCRRYWTKGGTLRNVPVGGGCRKNKRSSSSSSSISAVAAAATSSNSTSSSALSKIGRPQDHHIMQQHHHHHGPPHPHPLSIITSNLNNPLLSGLPYDSTCTDLSLAFARLQNQANGHLGYDQFDHNYQNSNNTLNHLGFLDEIRGGFLENNAPNGFHNALYNGGNIGNGEILMGLNNCSSNQDHDQEMMNPMFHDHQETCGAATMAVTTTTVKQESCNMMRSSDSRGGVLWGFPWQMGAGGGEQVNMVHEVESGRWNGIGSTTWHGLINSPLM